VGFSGVGNIVLANKINIFTKRIMILKIRGRVTAPLALRLLRPMFIFIQNLITN